MSNSRSVIIKVEYRVRIPGDVSSHHVRSALLVSNTGCIHERVFSAFVYRSMQLTVVKQTLASSLLITTPFLDTISSVYINMLRRPVDGLQFMSE
jgi:hypothetical protein